MNSNTRLIAVNALNSVTADAFANVSIRINCCISSNFWFFGDKSPVLA